MKLPEETLSFLTAMGVGFLIGIVRERLHQPGAMMAGVRTHTVAALMGAVAFSLGSMIFGVALAIAGILIGVGYYKSYAKDPGMTGEVSLMMTVLLGGLAIHSNDLAAALGVAVAVLLFLKKPLRQFSQELLTENELEDALILFSAALIVLPLLPQQAIDPWGALQPFARLESGCHHHVYGHAGSPGHSPQGRSMGHADCQSFVWTDIFNGGHHGLGQEIEARTCPYWSCLCFGLAVYPGVSDVVCAGCRRQFHATAASCGSATSTGCTFAAWDGHCTF